MRYQNLCLSLFINVLFCINAQAQDQVVTGGILDSTVIPAKKMKQQNEFWNNTYSFPSKPRNQWEIGASFGVLGISGDIPSVFPTFGFEAHVRKALGYIFSLRLQYLNGTGKGLRFDAPIVNSKNPAWLDNSANGNLPNGKGYNAEVRDNLGNLKPLSTTLNGGKVQNVFTNYKTHIQDLSLQGILTMNNIRFHKQKTKLTMYGGFGVGFTAYHAMVNALDASGNNYTNLFNELSAISGTGNYTKDQKKNVLKRLKNEMDNTYETEAESEKNRRGSLGNNTLLPSANILVGLSYRLGKRINIALEDRQTFIKSDLLDGQRWQVQPVGDVAFTSDYDTYNFLSLGLNFNIGAKAVEPLWWLNPLDYAYSEINQPKHMKLPKPVFDDADGDGVTDQLDREPNTVAGAPVDTHGVAKDTDGDGVPDYKDKQLITPTECQPVDADGVGKCPAPECCVAITKEIADLKAKPQSDCPNDYPSIRLNKAILSSDGKVLLDIIAKKLQEHPACTITISAYPKANKRMQALAVKKVELIKTYLIEKAGITAERISTNFAIEGGDPDTIDFK